MFKAEILFENSGSFEIINVINIQLIPRTKTTYSSYSCVDNSK